MIQRDPRRDPEVGDVLEDGWILTVLEVVPRTDSRGSLVRYSRHLPGEARRDVFARSLGGWRSLWNVLGVCS